MNKARIYSCPDHIQWVKDAAGVVVVDNHGRQVHLLEGIESAVWDWLMLGYAQSRMTSLISALLDLPIPLAGQKLQECLDRWNSHGLLEVEWEDQHG